MRVVTYRKHFVWRVKLIGGNNEIILNSEAYASRSNAERSAKRLREVLGL